MTEFTDDQILAYEDELKEASKLVPLVAPRESMMRLLKEYEGNSAINSKLKTMDLAKFDFRRSRGDGNCFYRSFAFGYLEFILNCYMDTRNDTKQVLLLRALEKFKEASTLLDCVGFQKLVYEDYQEIFENILNNVIPSLAKDHPNPVEALREKLEEDGQSDSLVVFLRLITSAYLRINESNYVAFLENGMSMDDFCTMHVENFGRESDHLHIVAISEALHAHITVLYMDASDTSFSQKNNHFEPIRHLFSPMCEVKDPSACFCVSLLYRPGHYDLLYDPEANHVNIT